MIYSCLCGEFDLIVCCIGFYVCDWRSLIKRLVYVALCIKFI